jgi:hypothetical protein
MKFVTYVLIAIIALSMTAFAAAGNTGSMNLISSGKINGTQLDPGSYKLTWTGQGNNVQVNIEGKGVKVTVPATVVNDQKSSEHDMVMKSAEGNVQEVHFGGKKTVLKFEGTAGAAGK